MPFHSTRPISQAIILAAGNGDRFHSGTAQSKLLAHVGGAPLLMRTLAATREAGITDAHLVLGYDAERVRASASAFAPDGLHLHFHLNQQWRQENGISVLAARPGVDGRPFALLMGDHLFETRVLRRLLELPRQPGEVLLGIDCERNDSNIALEATRVRVRNGQVVAIGKNLEPYDALDTGLFVCPPLVFDALAASCAAGDTTLSGGVRRLAERDLVRGVDIGDAGWCDIDTVADVDLAEQFLRTSRV